MGIFDKVNDIVDDNDDDVVTTSEETSDMYSAEHNTIDATSITPEDVQRDFARGTEPPEDTPLVAGDDDVVHDQPLDRSDSYVGDGFDRAGVGDDQSELRDDHHDHDHHDEGGLGDKAEDAVDWSKDKADDAADWVQERTDRH